MKIFGTSLLLALSLVSLRAADLPSLNPTPSNQSLPGKIIWADLFTNNPKAEAQFYTGLFGWTATTLKHRGHKYIVLSSNGQPVAGIVEHAAPKGDTGRGRWISYISVTDVAATVKTAVNNGGKVILAARTVAARGTQALLADNEGSLLGVIASSSGDPLDDEPAIGTWAWAHVFAPDPAGAAQFYHAVLGYEAAQDPRDNRQDIYLLNSQGLTRAALGPITPHPEAKGEWLGFIRVANLDDAVARATSLGGHVLVDPKSTRPESRVAIIADPSDVAIGLVELSDATALEKQAP